MTSQQLCGSALALFWAALQRQHESHRNDSEKRIFEAGQDALMQDTELPGVCLRWMRQANSQAATIREQEGHGKRKGAGGGGAMTQKRSCSSAPLASPIVESSSTFPFSEPLLLPYGGSRRVGLPHPPKANAWQFFVLHECI